ncbi:chemotaxis protein CheD [Halanaerobium sp. Z-7514]|uniref:Probable chemoreceptor glutamine deamidase CheD n=1 Tax=Halanaerobium polyolivorans TaxID=2886943 RepID=A0AAW4X092_9FIRM|nr:chemotaxis protein CheD [Halanaerobium polyolivorans]MCC3145215.1 chemotaxis protein CheD [Halanaerobium polyolivorans]
MSNLVDLEQAVEKKVVKMAGYAVAEDKMLLATLGLGSCIGIALYDRYQKIGALGHIMLPENPGGKIITKYADTAIPFLVKKMEELGAKKRRLTAKIVGGSNMFKSENGESVMKIGQRNIEAVKRYLKKENIYLKADDVGRDYGRSMYFYTEDGRVEIKSFKKELIVI